VMPSSANAETRNNVLKVLGADVENSKFKNIIFHPGLKNTWSRWMKQGLPDRNKTEIIERSPQSEFRDHAITH